MSFPGEGLHDNMLTIRINRDFSIDISPVDLRADRLESCDHIGCGVTERVPAPAADERDLWTPGLQQLA